MRVDILSEHGYSESLLGLSLSHGAAVDKMPDVARRLSTLDGGHNKFLESIVVWFDVWAPRYWWQEFDTYRVGVTKQSESTMHTLTKSPLQQEDFEWKIPGGLLKAINCAIARRELDLAKALLPECFIQRRIVCCNYKSLRNIILQRRTHKLSEWRQFCGTIRERVEHPEFLEDCHEI